MGVRIPPGARSPTPCPPSMLGSMISTTRRSNFVPRASSRLVWPSRARSTAKPASRRPLARKAAVFFSSTITRIPIASTRPMVLCVRCILQRRQGNHQTGKQECDCRREKTIATVGVEEEGLHIHQAEGGEEHRPNCQNEKWSRARVAESREGGEAECAEVSQQPECGHGYSSKLCIGAAQHAETIRRSSTSSRF